MTPVTHCYCTSSEESKSMVMIMHTFTLQEGGKSVL